MGLPRSLDSRPGTRALAARSRWARAALALVTLAALGSLAPLFAPEHAAACGAFFRESVPVARRPSLQHEQVLIVHDEAAGRQHFVRELAFVAGTEPFGFVVPTPARPEVAKVATSPFVKLRDAFPFEPPKPDTKARGGGIGLGDVGGFGYGGSSGVRVLEVKKVGSFTSFVIQATDEKGFSRWLETNKLTKPTENEAWLGHYVRLGFYFVALRYDPPPADDDANPFGVDPGRGQGTSFGAPQKSVKAETVRISFDSPLPYYPYHEPAPTPGASRPPRLMELWLVTSEARQPVGARTEGDRTKWLRPLREGHRQSSARAALEGALGAELGGLLPKGELVVQTFQDQKRQRVGMGDLLFPTERRRELSPAEVSKLEPLLGLLDPMLVPPAKGAP